MKRFKKSLVTLLVLVFVLSIMSTGFAASFSDVKDENVADAVARLTALNIINGYPDGTFKPENTITRAEFAKVVVNALGLGNAAQYAKGMTKFKDVTSTHWASGYIQVASDLGIVKGYPDGTFKPEANVTYAEAITMIMRALGYEPKATALGGYPGGYLAVAAEKGVTDDVNVVSNLGATRGDVAKMINNALEVPLMEQTSFGANPTWTETNKNLLENKLSVKKVLGTVNSYDEDENKVTIETNDYDVAEGISFKGLEGAKVTAWKKDGKIIFFAVDSEVVYDTVKSIGTDGKIELAFAGKKYEKNSTVSVSVDKYYKFIINDGKIDNAEELIDGNTVSPKLVKEVNTTKDKEYIRTYTSDSSVTSTTKLDPSAFTIVKNNKIATLADIKPGDVIYIVNTTSQKVIVAFDLKVEGKLTAYKQNDYIKVNGTTYYVDGVTFSTDNGDTYDVFNDDLFNTNVVALKGIKNKIVFVKGNVASSTAEFYGFALDKTSSLGEYKVKVLKDDGTIAVYNYKSSVDSYLPTSTGDLTKFFKFSLNSDGVIDSVTVYNAVCTHTITDAGNGYMKVVGDAVYYVSNSVKVFNMEGTGVIDSVYTNNIAKPEDVEIVNWADIVNAKNIDLDVIAYKASGDSEYKAIVITRGYSALAGDEFVGFVKDAYKVSTDKYEAVIITSAGEKTYTFSTDIIGKIDKLITYREKGANEAVYTGETTVSTTVYDVDTTRLLVKLSGNVYKKVASDVLIVEKNADGDPEVISLSDLKVEVEAADTSGVSIKYYIDADTEIIKAITIGY
ncbi:MAG: S-layer homology domain-containing protein [Thermovenabulum sp.]|uniref:S-layer homology domain-containing protein n=1 Tax=Thermovenabulum sp. TaxID=3100335 RepID=UPI003C7C8ACC